MGFELKLHIGTVSTPFTSSRMSEEEIRKAEEAYLEYEREWGRGLMEIAAVDLSGVGGNSRIYDMWHEATTGEVPDGIKRFLYGTDELGAETHVIEDRNGTRIGQLGFFETLAALRADAEDSKRDYSGHVYHRFELALATMEVIGKRWGGEGMSGMDRLAVFTWAH